MKVTSMVVTSIVVGLSLQINLIHHELLSYILKYYLGTQTLVLMGQDRFSLNGLKEHYEKGDRDKILSSLSLLKKHLRGAKNVSDVDRETYQILINLIKCPNAKIMDLSVSILADCCLKDSHREMFRELGGIPHIVLILKTVDNDNILFRACRLIGNLAKNQSLASTLNECNTGFILLKTLDNINDGSVATISMTFRAIKKLWSVKQGHTKMLQEDIWTTLINCLNSTNELIVIRSIEALTLFFAFNRSHIRTGLKELLAKLVDLSKREEMTDLSVYCLSNFICYQTNEVWKHLEGSRLPETFIEYIQRKDHLNKVVLDAFCELCNEGAVRNKIKTAGLLPKLMKLCSGSNTSKILLIFYMFQFDESVIEIFSQDKDFVSLLTRNITKVGVVQLLSAISRQYPPAPALVSQENLNIILNHKECHGILLKKILQTREFLRPLIASGRIWEIPVNCLEAAQNDGTERILRHLLCRGERSEVENTALAVPFLVQPRYFSLHNVLARNNGISVILRLLKERPLEERILAAIVKIINILQENFYENYKTSRGFFDFSLMAAENMSPCGNKMPEDVTMTDVENLTVSVNVNENFEDSEIVTFELDCGTSITAKKNLLCKNSPVLDAMLNGHFIESSQQKVKLSCCSAEALQCLEQLLANKGSISPVSDVSIETHLELISLTDRFMMSDLNNLLSVNLPLNQSSCLVVLHWCRNSGQTKNNDIITKKAYEFVFSSSANLLIAMKNDTFRTPLINEISEYFSTSFEVLP